MALRPARGLPPMLLPFLWLPLLWLQVENRSPEVEWSEVPVFSAERLESAGPSWMAVDGWKTSRPRVDDVRNPLLVAVTVTNFEGFYGRWVELRLRSSAGEGVEAADLEGAGFTPEEAADIIGRVTARAK